MAPEAGNASVARGEQNGHAHQAELHVLGTLASAVASRPGILVATVRHGDDLGRVVHAAHGLTGVRPRGGGIVRVDAVPHRVVAAAARAVGPVDGVEEVVVCGGVPRYAVAHLVQRHVLGVGERHGVAQVQVGLAADSGTGLGGQVTAVNAVEDGGGSVGNLSVAVNGEEGVQVVLVVALGGELDDAKAVALHGINTFGNVITATVSPVDLCDSMQALTELSDTPGSSPHCSSQGGQP